MITRPAKRVPRRRDERSAESRERFGRHPPRRPLESRSLALSHWHALDKPASHQAYFKRTPGASVEQRTNRRTGEKANLARAGDAKLRVSGQTAGLPNQRDGRATEPG